MATGSVEVKLKSIRLFDPNEYEEPSENIDVKSTDDDKYPGNYVTLLAEDYVKMHSVAHMIIMDTWLNQVEKFTKNIPFKMIFIQVVLLSILFHGLSVA